MDPVLVDLVYVKIYWYSVIVLLAFLFGGYVAMKEAKKYEISEDDFVNFLFFLVPFSLLGARIYYIIFNWSYYQSDLMQVFRVWEGGLAIHGGILFGFVWVVLYARSNQIRLIRFLDIIAPALLLGQALGRWGNFFNQEAYGPVTTAAKLESFYIPDFIIEGMYINGSYYHPTFLYEFGWCILGYLFLIIIRRFVKYLKIGQLTGLGLIWLGAGRYYIEGMRLDSLMLGDYRIAQIVSIVMIFIGIITFFAVMKRSRFDNLYSEKDVNPLKLGKEFELIDSDRVRDEEIIEEDIEDEN